METSFLGDRQVWSSERNEFVSEKMMTLATVLHDYNPNLSLTYIPRQDRDETDSKPYAIVEQQPGRPPQIIRYLSEREIQNTPEVLAWVFEGDLTKQRPGDLLSKIELREKAEELLRLKQREEELEDIQDHAQFMFTGGRNKLHTFKHNGQTYRR